MRVTRPVDRSRLLSRLGSVVATAPGVFQRSLVPNFQVLLRFWHGLIFSLGCCCFQWAPNPIFIRCIHFDRRILIACAESRETGRCKTIQVFCTVLIAVGALMIRCFKLRR